VGSSHEWQFHKGVDFKGNGEPVTAIEDGIVEKASSICPMSPVNICNNNAYKNRPGYKDCNCNEGYGNYVSIKHKGFYSYYYHLGKVFVKAGRYVKKGDKIGTIGNSGHSSGSHLHFGIGKAPFEMPYRVSNDNFYDPCTLFTDDVLNKLSSKIGKGGCLQCDAKCVDGGINKDDSNAVQRCINMNDASKETASIPLVDGGAGILEMVCYR